MTVIRPNSISGITSLTAHRGSIDFYAHDGSAATFNNINSNVTSGVSTFASLNITGDLDVGGALTYEDVTNVDSIGIVTARNGIDVTGGTVNITTGTNSASPAASGDNLVIKDNDGCGISILSGDGNSQNIYLGSTSDNDGVRLEGFYNSGNPYFNIYTGGSQRFLISSTGKIGIDNTTPHRQLVVGDGGDISCFGANGGIYFGTSTGGFRNNGAIARAEQAGYHVSGSQVGDLVMAPEADKDLIFSTGSTNTMVERLRFDTGGNIGINDSGPNFHLDVNGNVALREGQVLTWHDGSGNKAGDVYMDSSDNFVIRNTSSIAERLRIDSAGRLMLGQTSAYSATGTGTMMLTVTKSTTSRTDAAISNQSNGDNASAALVLATHGQDYILEATGSGNTTDGTGAFRILKGTDERLRINSSGQVSLGNEPSSGAGLLNLKPSSGDEYFKIRDAGDFDPTLNGIAFDMRNSANTTSKDLVVRSLNLVLWQNTSERLRIKSDGSLLHKGDNSNTIDNTDGDGQASAGYPAGGATFNKNISVNNNAGGFGQCMNMISHTKSITLNGSTDHDMVTIWNREGCFIGHVYAGYSTSGDGAVVMYKFNTFYSANSIIAELGPSSRTSDSISVNISSSADRHTFRVNGNGFSGDVTIGLVFLSAGVAGSSAHYGVRYY